MGHLFAAVERHAAPSTGAPPAHGREPVALAVVGASHARTPVSVRERLSVMPDELPAALRRAGSVEGVAGAVLVSTCNRTELYLAADAGRVDRTLERAAWALWAPVCDCTSSGSPGFYRLSGFEAVRHLFEVACGLDSLVPGETQVVAQVKAAHAAALAAGTAGGGLSRLFQRALRISKGVRGRTGISRRRVSLASVAVDLARDAFGDLRGLRVALVGAGRMAGLALRALLAEGARLELVASRSRDSARRLAGPEDACVAPLDELGARLCGADIIVACAAVRCPVLTAAQVRLAAGRRRGRPLLLLDLGVPRNIEEGVAEVANARLHDLDALQSVVAANRSYRLEQAGEARRLVGEETARFMEFLRSRTVSPEIRELTSRLRTIEEEECRSALAGLGALTPSQRRRVASMARRIVGRILHQPIAALKDDAGRTGGPQLARTLRRLFDLPCERPGR